jgi:hypothetical protein
MVLITTAASLPLLRQVLATIEEGEYPEESFVLGHTKVELHGWISIVHVNAFRKVLGGGIQTHLRENELVQEYLDIDVVASQTSCPYMVIIT